MKFEHKSAQTNSAKEKKCGNSKVGECHFHGLPIKIIHSKSGVAAQKMKFEYKPALTKALSLI